MNSVSDDNKSVVEFLAILWNIWLFRDKLVFNNGKQTGTIIVLKMVSISIQRWLTDTIHKDEKGGGLDFGVANH